MANANKIRIGTQDYEIDPAITYCTCSTAAGTAAKTASLTNFTLRTGSVVQVKFTYSNTASSPTLNVNGTGTKAIKKYGTTAAGTDTFTSWPAGAVITFVYDGTNWLMADHADTGNAAGLAYTSLSNNEIQLKSGTTNLYPTFAVKTIENGADLNDIMDVGIWNCYSSVTAASLTNSPITNAGFPMIVYIIGEGNARMQVIFGGSTIYARRRTTSSWGSWYQYSGTQV